MYKLISWYNQNRRKVWVAIFAIGIIGMILWRMLYIVTENNTSVAQPEQTSRINTDNFNSIAITSERSAISGQKIVQDEKEISTIDEFFSYCNSGKIQEAYDLLSDECKDEMYTDINMFKETYYDNLFGKGKRNVSIENWISNIYKVTLSEDFIATGKYSSESTLQDYITITKDNEKETKLNINKYIGRTTLNKAENTENVDVKVIKKDSYMDYEIYTFEIKNNTDNQILLGDLKDIDFSYLTDENGLKYKAYTNELSEAQVTFTAKQTKQIRIKYFNQYSSTRKINNLIFPKIKLKNDIYSINDETDTIQIKL